MKRGPVAPPGPRLGLRSRVVWTRSKGRRPRGRNQGTTPPPLSSNAPPIHHPAPHRFSRRRRWLRRQRRQREQREQRDGSESSESSATAAGAARATRRQQEQREQRDGSKSSESSATASGVGRGRGVRVPRVCFVVQPGAWETLTLIILYVNKWQTQASPFRIILHIGYFSEDKKDSKMAGLTTF